MFTFEVDNFYNYSKSLNQFNPNYKMKKIILLFILLISAANYSQIAISPSYRGDDEEFKKEELNNLKKTTTVFVLPNVYKKEEYEKILKEVWTITPFIVVNSNDFKVYEYADGNYSIATFFGDVVVSTGSHHAVATVQDAKYAAGTKYIHTNLALKTIDPVKFQKDFVKLEKDDKKYSKKLSEIFGKNSSFIAKVPLNVTTTFLNDVHKATLPYNVFGTGGSDEKLGVVYDKMFHEVCFTNTNLGMLKNYFQQINESLSKGEHYGLYDDFSKPEIKNLKENILYIPEVYKMKYNRKPFKSSEELREDKDIKELFEDYKYKYEFISDADLEKRILNNEAIYYLRYVSMNGNKYLQVVNAKSSNPVYYFYGVMSYNLKDDDFKKINEAINKVNKS